MFGSTLAGFAVVRPAILLAASNDPGGHGDDFGKSSPVGLLLLVLFLIATAFLVRSMNKHLKKVPASFDDPEDGSAAGGSESGSAEGAAEPGTAADGSSGSANRTPGKRKTRKTQSGTSDGATASN